MSTSEAISLKSEAPSTFLPREVSDTKQADANGKPKYFFIAFVVGEIVGIILLGLSASHVVGPFGSIGFFASVTAGGFLCLFSTGCIFYLAITQAKKAAPPLHLKKRASDDQAATTLQARKQD